jgi:hypothetical protein
VAISEQNIVGQCANDLTALSEGLSETAMTTIFPSGNHPYTFSDSLAQDSGDTSQANRRL